MKKWIISLLLLFVFCTLFSCEMKDPDGMHDDNETLVVLDHRYSVHQLTPPQSCVHPDQYPYSSVFWTDQEIYCLTRRDILTTEGEEYDLRIDWLFSVYDKAGNFVREERIPLTHETVRPDDVCSIYPIPGGYVYLAIKFYENNTPEIGMISEDGTLIEKITPSTQGAPTCFAADDRYICYADTECCHIYSPMLDELYMTSCSFPVEMIRFDEDRLIAGDGYQNYVSIDPVNQKTDLTALSLPNGIMGSVYDGNAAYYFAHDGVYIEDELLLDWDNSSMRSDRTTLLAVMDHETMIVQLDDPIIGGKYYAVLNHVPEDEQETVILTATVVGYTNNQSLTDAIYSYNRQSEKYHIVVRDYDAEFREKYGYPAADYMQLVDEIVRGEQTDIYLFGPVMNLTIKELAEQHAFADLSDIVPENVFSFAKDAFRVRDEVYGLMLGVYEMRALACEKEHAKDSFTVDQMLDIVDALPPDHVLFSEPVGYELQYISLHDFYDKENGSSHFDSPQFIRYLEMLEKQNSFSKPTYGGLTYSVDREEYELINGNSPADALRSGKLSYLVLPIEDMDVFAYAKFCFGNRSFALSGFPSNRKNFIYANSACTFLAGAKPQNRNGMRDFLDYLISDTIQTSPGWNRHSIPVTESAFREMFTEYNYIGVNSISGENNRNSYFYKFTGTFGSGHRRQDEFVRNTLLLYETEIMFSKEEADDIVRFFADASVMNNLDHTVQDIVAEELSSVKSGVRSYQEAADLIQKRVRLYVNE